MVWELRGDKTVTQSAQYTGSYFSSSKIRSARPLGKNWEFHLQSSDAFRLQHNLLPQRTVSAMGVFSPPHWLFHGISSVAARDCWASIRQSFLPLPIQLIYSISHHLLPVLLLAKLEVSKYYLGHRNNSFCITSVTCVTVKTFAYSSSVWDYISEPQCCLQEIHSFMWQYHVITAPSCSGRCLKSLTTSTGSRCRVKWKKKKSSSFWMCFWHCTFDTAEACDTVVPGEESDEKGEKTL